MRALPEGCEKQLWQEFESVPKEPLQFISLALLLLKSSDVGTPEHTKVWEKACVYDGILKVFFLSTVRLIFQFLLQHVGLPLHYPQ